MLRLSHLRLLAGKRLDWAVWREGRGKVATQRHWEQGTEKQGEGVLSCPYAVGTREGHPSGTGSRKKGGKEARKCELANLVRIQKILVSVDSWGSGEHIYPICFGWERIFGAGHLGIEYVEIGAATAAVAATPTRPTHFFGAGTLFFTVRKRCKALKWRIGRTEKVQSGEKVQNGRSGC